MTATLLAVIGCLAGPAFAAPADAPSQGSDVEAGLGEVEARAVTLGSRAAALDVATRPGGYLTHDEAVIRFQEYLFLELVGDHGPAAEGFYALVTTGTLDDDLGLEQDAEWYLAESLMGLGNLKTAAARFQLIVDKADHPFRADAVRRLLELHASSGDRDAFSRLYDAEIASGRVQPTPLITYSLAKSFYQQGDYARARVSFSEVPTDSPWYGRARYFVGVIDVLQRDLAAATANFQAVAELPVVTSEDRLVHDEALLAVGRVAYDRGEYLAAAEAYNQIEGDSRYQADKLYEVVWTSIRAERWRDALNNVEIFLLAFPEHQYAAQLALLQGHLNFQEQSWPDALTSYGKVIADYTPVQQRFATLAQPGTESDAAVREVLEPSEGTGALPAYAVSMMRADPELGRSMDLFADLDAQRRDIEVSERLIAELSAYVDAGGAVGSTDRARAEAFAAKAEVIGARLAVAAIESSLSGEDDAKRPLVARRQAMEARQRGLEAKALAARAEVEAFDLGVAQDPMGTRTAPAGLDAASVSELDLLYAECAALVDEMRAGRSRGGDSRMSRIDALHGSLDGTWQQLGRSLGGSGAVDPNEIGRLRAEFAREVTDVAVERNDYALQLDDARSVALGLTRGGFGRLEDFFADSVLKADMGIVDVYWAQKLALSDELTRIKEEKDGMLADLERRFQLIHEKMGDAQ